MKYGKTEVIDWFGKVFGINHMPNKNEMKTHCPYCNHPSFFFNARKGIGYCHHDVCGRKPTLQDLIELAGYAPDEFGVSNLSKEEGEKSFIELPGRPLVFWKNQELMTHYPEAVHYLYNRHITGPDMLRFNMTCDGSRVYVPVMEEGRIVNYVGRDLTGEHPKKYKYAPGQKTSWHIFGWEECKDWDWITLVENTFVSIWLRNKINCTTTFGSHISDVQLDMIKKANLDHVIIMWDAGAEAKAERAMKSLKSIGTEAIYVRLPNVKGKKQPDDYRLDTIVHNVQRAKEALYKEPFIKWEDK